MRVIRFTLHRYRMFGDVAMGNLWWFLEIQLLFYLWLLINTNNREINNSMYSNHDLT